MKLAIDGNEANVTSRVGSNVYAYQLIKHFYQLAHDSNVDVQVYFKQEKKVLFPRQDDHWLYKTFGPKTLWTQWRLPLELYKNNLTGKSPDLYFTPGHYAPRFSPIPSVISIMDLAFFKFPNEFRKRDLKQLHAWTKYSVNNAKHIFAISHATKTDIIKYYQIPEEKITVTHLGINDISKTKRLDKDNSFANMRAHFGITKPYLIYIGTLQPRKNINNLIDAFVLLKKDERYKDQKLVLVGKKGWLYADIFKKVEHLGLYDDVIFTGFVSDFEKFELIRHAKAYVLPSLYEGFGLPVLESMSVGTPVVISKVSSLPEVGGESAFYIDNPNSADNIAKSIMEVLQLGNNRRLEVIAKGKKWANQFTWQNCAEKTFNKLIKLNA